MIVKVIKEKESVIYNGIIYDCGKTFEADDIICKSLINRGYVEEISAPIGEVDETVDEAETVEGFLDEKDLQGMSYAELKHLAAEMGLDATGKKADLIARISSEAVDVEEDAILDESNEADGDLPNTNMPE